jgi:hypothetical protein
MTLTSARSGEGGCRRQVLSLHSEIPAVPHLPTPTAEVAAGGTVIERPSPLNVCKDTYDHSC